MPKSTSCKRHERPFAIGQIPSDPTTDSGQDPSKRFRLNVDIDEEDYYLLKTLDIRRGIVQLVTSNLLHGFITTLRRLNISGSSDRATAAVNLARAHFVLACWSGYDPRGVSDLETLSGTLQPLLEYLPRGLADAVREEVLRDAAARADRAKSGPNESGGVAGVCGDAENSAQKPANDVGQDSVGRGQADGGARPNGRAKGAGQKRGKGTEANER